MSAPDEKPLLRVVRGNPSDAELAALTAVVAAASARPAPRKQRRTSWWGDRAAALRKPLHPGEGAWRASGFPQ